NARPYSTRGWTTPRCKNRRALIAQPAVRPHLIVFLPEVAHHDPSFRQRPQLFPVQAFVPKPTMEAFHKPVLPRAARLNVNGLDAIVLQPSLHNPGDELRTVVASQKLRRTVLANRLLQPLQHIRRLQRPFRSQHMTFPGVFVQDRQHPQRPATHGGVRDEVPRPHLIPMRRTRRQSRGNPAPNKLPLRRWNAQSFSRRNRWMCRLPTPTIVL